MTDVEITALATGMLATARGILESGVEAIPVIALVATDGTTSFIGCPFRNAAEKDAAAALMGRLAAEPQTDWMLFLSDAFITTIDGVHQTRRESLMLTVQGARGERWIATQTYTRRGKALTFSEIAWQRDAALEGRFALPVYPD